MNEYYQKNWLQFYARVAPEYSTKTRKIAALIGGEDNFHNTCHELLDIQQKKTVLDMCCGVGTFTISLVKNIKPKGRVLGVDLSPEMVRIAEQNNRNEAVEFQVMDVTKTNLVSETFDAITIIAALHEMPYEHRAAVLSEANRLLVPNGLLLVGEHYISKSPLYQLIQKVIFRMISKKPERTTFNDMVQRGLVNEIMDAGFDVKSIKILPLHFFHIVLSMKPGKQGNHTSTSNKTIEVTQ